jgi:uncharacterized protein (TIGR03067 family)
MKCCTRALLVMALAIAAQQWFPPGAHGDDAKDLNGTWVIVRAEANGEDLSDAFVGKSVLKVEGGKHTLRLGDEKTDGTHHLYPTQEPKAYDLEVVGGPLEGTKTLGIYRFDGDKLIMCSSPAGKPRPKEFSAAKGTDQLLIVWKRQSK